MSTLYANIEEMKVIFTGYGYSIYDINEYNTREITRESIANLPMIFIGRQEEVLDGDTLIDWNVNTAEININVVLPTTKETLFADCETELRRLKDIIYTNRNHGSFWTNWTVINNRPAQLANTTDHSDRFGGININSTIQYREQQIQGVL